MDPIDFVPLMLVGIFALVFPHGLRHARPVRLVVIAALGWLFVNYLSWRVPVTVLPATTLDAQSLLVWTVFAIEALAWLDATMLFACLTRRTDRRPEADAHEARLRVLPAHELPEVDVFIATYNESLDVLERTIIGATALDWPAEKLKVWVLDDGRRDWLRDFCASRQVGYFTRPDNKGAKAGNINAAIRRTSGAFFAIFDADFIPRRNFLYRMIGFFADPRIGIVQAPHSFFNHDPLQANLAMRRTLPGDQRLFFDEIMPGRDGWDCAFCCGSNSITRRTAIEEIGNGLPTDSITEDMLLTLALLRKGYVTRYLNERLAVGLAPESLDALFVQRMRWAQGALQILYLREGPLGTGLGPVKRMMFLPNHWLSQALTQVAGLTAPCIYLLTGLLPLENVTADAVIYYQLPFILGAISALRFFAPEQYFLLPAMVLGVLQSFRFLPTLFGTLVRPAGHAFKVTPKGANAAGRGYDRFTVVLCVLLLTAYAAGFVINSDLNSRIVADVELMPIIALWSICNTVILMLALVTAVAAPPTRDAESFISDEPTILRVGGTALDGRLHEVSLAGAAITTESDAPVTPGDWIAVAIPDVGEVPARVVRAHVRQLAVAYWLRPSPARDRMIRKLFTSGRDNTARNDDALEVTLQMLLRIFGAQPDKSESSAPPAETPPQWLFDEIASRERTFAKWDADVTAASGANAGRPADHRAA